MNLAHKYEKLIILPLFWQDKLLKIAEELRHDFACDRVTLFFKDNDGRFVSIIAQGLAGMTIDVKLGEGLAGKCLLHRKAIISNNPEYDHRSLCRVRDSYTGYTTHSVIAVPIFSFWGSPLGIIQLVNKTAGLFSEQEAAQLQDLTPVFRCLYKEIPQPIVNIWGQGKEELQ